MLDPNCPYRCNGQNRYLDRGTAQLVACPHCTEKAEEFVSEPSVEMYQHFGFPTNLNITQHLDIDLLFPDYELDRLTPQSVSDFKSFLESLWSNLKRGILPERSLCIGMGIKGRFSDLVFPLLAASYTSGLTTHPVVLSADLLRWKLEENMDALEEVHSAQTVIVFIEEGSTRVQLHAVKGLMQIRALRGLPTIIVTTWSVNSVNVLLDNDPHAGYSLAEPHFVIYKSSEYERYSAYSLGILGLNNSVSSESTRISVNS